MLYTTKFTQKGLNSAFRSLYKRTEGSEEHNCSKNGLGQQIVQESRVEMCLPVNKGLGSPGDVIVAHVSKSITCDHNWAKDSSEKDAHLEEDDRLEQSRINKLAGI